MYLVAANALWSNYRTIYILELASFKTNLRKFVGLNKANTEYERFPK